MGEDELSLLSELGGQLREEASIESRLKALADVALSLTGADHASLRLCDELGYLRPYIRSGVGTDRPPEVFQRGEGIVGWVAATGVTARVSNVSADVRFDQRVQQGFGVASLLCIPLIWRDKVRAVLSLSAARAEAFDERHEKIASLLGHWASDTLRIQELEALAITDPHTRAFNARYLAQRLPEEMQRTLRSGDPLSLLLLDLDHFKRINDTHGHKVGDAVLRAFAQVVRRHIRNTDVLIRRGGEEFVLLLPTTDTEQAFAVAERIRSALSEEPLELRGGLHIRQTVSIGIACWDGEEGAEHLEARADRAMYRAKRRGRDRVCHAERRALRSSGLLAMDAEAGDDATESQEAG